MNHAVKLEIQKILPDEQSILNLMGVPAGKSVSGKIKKLLASALDIFINSASPVAVFRQLSKDEFDSVYQGEGNNDKETPLEIIFPRADHLALCALTLGHEVCSKITDLFKANDFAVGALLDAVASAAADKASGVCETYFSSQPGNSDFSKNSFRVLNYSPGYCGWHISGQKKLFQFLQPEKIGIRLNDNYLMTPLKSVTGVLVAGKEEIHIFKTNYPFCRNCSTHSCQPRMRGRREGKRVGEQ